MKVDLDGELLGVLYTLLENMPKALSDEQLCNVMRSITDLEYLQKLAV